MIRFGGMHMPHLNIVKHFNKGLVGKCTVQPNFDIVILLLSVVPSIWQPKKTKIRETTSIHSIPETIHLTLRSSYPAKLFPSIQDLFEISRANPWGIALGAQEVHELPTPVSKFMPRLTIEADEPPQVNIRDRINHRHINVKFIVRLQLHADII